MTQRFTWKLERKNHGERVLL